MTELPSRVNKLSQTLYELGSRALNKSSQVYMGMSHLIIEWISTFSDWFSAYIDQI
jgi:hypothetical protein